MISGEFQIKIKKSQSDCLGLTVNRSLLQKNKLKSNLGIWVEQHINMEEQDINMKPHVFFFTVIVGPKLSGWEKQVFPAELFIPFPPLQFFIAYPSFKCLNEIRPRF